jgi:hypothetical protein
VKTTLQEVILARSDGFFGAKSGLTHFYHPVLEPVVAFWVKIRIELFLSPKVHSSIAVRDYDYRWKCS